MILYIIKSFSISCVMYFIYIFALRYTNAFKFNRFFLLGTILLSAITPLINIPIKTNISSGSFEAVSSGLTQQFNLIGSKIESIPVEDSNSPFLLISAFIYSITLSFLLFRLVRNSKIILKAPIVPFKKLKGLKVIYHNNNTIYSFFNRLYVPVQYKTRELDNSILEHELTHAKQLHSIDNIISELFAITFWFNPFAWLLKTKIKENHEFLADQSALSLTDETTYMQHILNHIQHSNHPKLASNFSYLTLKSRFKMIQHQPSFLKKTITICLSLFLTISLFSLFAFKTEKINQSIDKQITTQTGFNLYQKPNDFPLPIKAITRKSSGFGLRLHPITKLQKLHKGEDFIAAAGTPILATANGKVIKAVKQTTGYGYHIVIQHNIKYKTLYAHLSELDITEGETIKKGQKIGVIGNTGTSVTTHLHYEIHEFDQPINPDLNIDC